MIDPTRRSSLNPKLSVEEAMQLEALVALLDAAYKLMCTPTLCNRMTEDSVLSSVWAKLNSMIAEVKTCQKP